MSGMSISEKLYKYDSKIKGYEKSFRNSRSISEPNKKAVGQFLNKCSARGLSKGRIVKIAMCTNTLLKLADKDFDFMNCAKEDLEKLVRKINQALKANGKPISEAYRVDLHVVLKQFYGIMQPTESNGYPAKAAWIPTTFKRNREDHPDTYSEDESQKMLAAAMNNRDRAMLKVLEEGGLRTGELINIRLKDCDFTYEYGIKIHVKGKTGPRTVLLVQSERYLRTWFAEHPYAGNPEAPLWVKTEHRSGNPEKDMLSYATFRGILRRIGIRAGVRVHETASGKMHSRVRAKIYRATSCSRAASHITESVMKQYYGWTPDSDACRRYLSLSGKQIEDSILKMNGITPKENKDEIIECPRCFRQNRNADFCCKCSAPLSIKTAMQKEQLVQKLDRVIDGAFESNLAPEELKQLIKSVI